MPHTFFETMRGPFGVFLSSLLGAQGAPGGLDLTDPAHDVVVAPYPYVLIPVDSIDLIHVHTDADMSSGWLEVVDLKHMGPENIAFALDQPYTVRSYLWVVGGDDGSYLIVTVNAATSRAGVTTWTANATKQLGSTETTQPVRFTIDEATNRITWTTNPTANATSLYARASLTGCQHRDCADHYDLAGNPTAYLWMAFDEAPNNGIVFPLPRGV